MTKHNLSLRIKDHFKQKWIWWLRSIWILLFVAFLIFMFLPAREESIKFCLGALKIYSGNKDSVAYWDRDKAIEFGLTQVATLINYLFVAAAAVLGLVSKVIIEPLVSPQKSNVIQPPASILLSHVAIGCFFSIFYGFVGATYVGQIPDSDGFSIYEEVGIGAAFQQIAFLFAAALLVIAATIMVKKANSQTTEDVK